MEAALIRDKLHVVPSENHDQMDDEASDSEETPCSSSGTDGEGVDATVVPNKQNNVARQIAKCKINAKYFSHH